MNMTPMTELEAVNTMLQVIGEQPVNSLTTSGLTEATLARQTLHRVSRQVQNMGLHCNTEEEYPLAPLESGEVHVPSNTLSMDPTDTSLDYILRGTRVYDRENHTYIFDSSIDVDIKFFLEFEELPQVVRDYIVIRAAREFLADVIGSVDNDQKYLEREAKALAAMTREELMNRDDNMLSSSTISDITNRSL